MSGDDFDFSLVSDADYAAVFGDQFGFGDDAVGCDAIAIFDGWFGTREQVVDFAGENPNQPAPAGGAGGIALTVGFFFRYQVGKLSFAGQVGCYVRRDFFGGFAGGASDDRHFCQNLIGDGALSVFDHQGRTLDDREFYFKFLIFGAGFAFFVAVALEYEFAVVFGDEGFFTVSGTEGAGA